MAHETKPTSNVSQKLLDAIKTFPLEKEFEHCGEVIAVSPFALYAVCPKCDTEIKLRSFTASLELEDVFDAVFAWMARPDAVKAAQVRMQEIADDE